MAKKVPVAKDGGTREAGSDSEAHHFRQPLAALQHEVDRLFDDFMSGWPFGGAGTRPAARPPRLGASGFAAADAVEQERRYLVSLELPGMSEKDIDITLTEDMLTISGEKSGERKEEKENFYLAERQYGSFQRTFRVPPGVDREKIEAKYEKGVLTLTLPKTKEARKQVRRIDVRAT